VSRLRRHWKLIVLALVVGLAVPAVAHAWDETRYIATSRLVIDAADPKRLRVGGPRSGHRIGLIERLPPRSHPGELNQAKQIPHHQPTQRR